MKEKAGRKMSIIQKSELTECELTTMKIVWDAGEPITCSEIIEQLKTKYHLVYKDTTVYTFLKNLKEKGFVDSYRRGITFFIPARSEVEYRKDQMERTKHFWYNDSLTEFVVALAEDQNMEKKDIASLKRLFKKYEE